MRIEHLSDYIVSDWMQLSWFISRQDYAKLIWELLDLVEGRIDPDEARDIPEHHATIQKKMATVLTTIFNQMADEGIGPEAAYEQIAIAASGIEDGRLDLAFTDLATDTLFGITEECNNEKGGNFVWDVWKQPVKSK